LIGLVLLPMAIPFITSVNVDTLPKRIWSGLRDNVDPSVAAISVLLISLTLLVLIGRLVAQHLADKRAQKLLHP
jgi:putative spermidine/putrescine transport system permease protein